MNHGQSNNCPLHDGVRFVALRPREITTTRGVGDRIFHRGAGLSGVSVLAIMAGVGLFLSIEAAAAFRERGFAFFTTAQWQPDRGVFGISSVLLFTVLIALIGVVIAVPLAMGTALFIVEVVPGWLLMSPSRADDRSPNSVGWRLHDDLPICIVNSWRLPQAVGGDWTSSLHASACGSAHSTSTHLQRSSGSAGSSRRTWAPCTRDWWQWR